MRYGVLILVCGLGGLAVHSAAQNLTSAGNNWVRSDGDPGATRYSTLTQITTSNVKSLARAWTFHTNSGRFAGAPMIVDNVMYFSAPNGVYALDATTGALLWRYPAAVPAAPLPASAEASGAVPQGRGAAPDPGRLGTPPPAAAGAGGGSGAGRGGFATVGSALFGEAQAGRGAGRGGADAAGTASRGPTYWEGTTGVAPRIFSLLTGGLAAIDAKTGTIVRTFGENGFLPEITSMSPPVIFKSMLITKGPTERGKGVTVKGFDIVSGQPRWTFYTKAQPGDPNRGTWLRDSADTEASPNIWGMFSVDEQRGLVFIPIERTEGNGGNDYWAGGNPGNTLYSQSLVALDAMTGKMKWFQQLVHHDIWDYDLAAAPVLVDVRRNGQVIPAVVETTKMGLMFIFHRETGEPIFGMEERPVAQTTVPGEWTSPTQPFPVKPEPLSRNSFKQSDLSTVTPEHQAFCRDLWDTNKLSDTVPYTPWKLGENVLVMPGAQGGSNFWGATFNRSLGLIIANVHDAGQWGMLQISTGRRGGGGAAPAAGNSPPPGATAPPVTGPVSYSKVPGPASRFWDTAKEWSCTQPPWGQLVAVNANTGDIAWRVPLGSFPELEAKGIKSGTPNSGGAITTAGNLVFIGATVDGYFRAFDARNGAELWRDKLPTPAHSTPATYLGRDGRQYVVIGANGGGFFGAPTFDDVIAYALPPAATAARRGGRR